MAQGGVTDTGYSEEFIENIVKYIREKPDLVEKLQELLKDNEDFKNLNEEFNELSVEDVTNLLKNSEEVLDNVVEHFTENKKDLEILIEQANKVKDMEGKLEALGNQLLIQGIIGGAAITALTGALAGTLAIGGAAGALMGGGLALAGLVALVAIAAIGYAIYQHRGEIKEGTESLGKAIKSFVKNIIDKLPVIQIQDRDKNFYKLYQESSQLALRAESEEVKNIQDKARVIEMLQDKGQLSAIKELIKDGTIQNFSEGEMKRLIEKGLSTHEADKKALEELMEKFLPEIVKIGNSDIKEVEEKVNGKVEQMKPPTEMEATSHEQVSPEEVKKL